MTKLMSLAADLATQPSLTTPAVPPGAKTMSMHPAHSEWMFTEDDSTVLPYGDLFARELDRGRLARLVVEETVAAIGAGVGALLLHHSEHLEPHLAHAADAEHQAELPSWIRVFLRLDRANRSEPERLRGIRIEEGLSVLSLPILGPEGSRPMLGRLYFGHRDPARFTPGLEQQVARIAARASIALWNALAFERLQRSSADCALRERRHAQILDSVRDMIFCVDSQANLVYANAAARRNRLLSERFGRELGVPSAAEAIFKVEPSPRGDSTIHRADIMGIDIEDDARYFHIVQNPIRDLRGHVIETVAIAHDVTDDRRQKELERRVAERTHALAEANRALAEANRELESFSYTVSHDLRAPIRHISGFVDLLGTHAADSLDDKSKRWLRTIADASRQMGALIDALLSFSRMARSELEADIVNLDALVDDVLRELEPDFRERQITWTRARLPSVRGDATMLKIVLTNLLSNAIKYTRSREEAQIEIGTSDEPASPETHTVLWVRDNGIGFDMEYSDKLFGVFQRLHSNREAEGTGIGLATVRRIIERHGGRAWAYGKPGEGATFYVTLPRIMVGGTDSEGSQRQQ